MSPHLGHPFRGPHYLPGSPPTAPPPDQVATGLLFPVTPASAAPAPPSPAVAPQAGVTDKPTPVRRTGRTLAAGIALSILAGGLAGAVTGGWGDDSPPAATAQLPQASIPSAAGGGPSIASAAESVLPGVVSVRAGRATGSGFAIDQEGHVVTNAHVVQGARSVSLVLSNGRRLDAEIIGVDADNDLAVLQVATNASNSGLRSLPLGRSAERPDRLTICFTGKQTPRPAADSMPRSGPRLPLYQGWCAEVPRAG